VNGPHEGVEGGGDRGPRGVGLVVLVPFWWIASMSFKTYEQIQFAQSIGLNLLIYGDVFHWGQLMAASVITTVPVVRPIHVHPSLDC
jgi:ABC-type glycerol-3-phosphate transport system permease component